MRIRPTILRFFLGAALVLSACGEIPDKAPSEEKVVEWGEVPQEFNPAIASVDFRTTGIEKLNVDIFSFKKDIEIVYDENMTTNAGSLILYKVWKGSASWGTVSIKSEGKNLEIKSLGDYHCAIKIKDKKIEELTGGCYVKIRIVLPKGSEIEVYNVGKLLSKRFIVLTTEEFLEKIVGEPFVSKKFILIQEYLQSYAGTTKSPQLSTNQLGVVLGEFDRTAHKFNVLKALHRSVTDRHNLSDMIDREFKSTERQKAREIVGWQ